MVSKLLTGRGLGLQVSCQLFPTVYWKSLTSTTYEMQRDIQQCLHVATMSHSLYSDNATCFIIMKHSLYNSDNAKHLYNVTTYINTILGTMLCVYTNSCFNGVREQLYSPLCPGSKQEGQGRHHS